MYASKRAVRPGAHILAPPLPQQTFLDRKEVAERVVAVLKNFEKVDPAKVTATANFVNDLGLDSLDAVEVRSAKQPRPGHARAGVCVALTLPLVPLQVCMALEEEFVVTIPDAEAEKILSVEDAIAFISTHPAAK